MSFHPGEDQISRQCLQKRNEQGVTIANYNHRRPYLGFSPRTCRHGAPRALQKIKSGIGKPTWQGLLQSDDRHAHYVLHPHPSRSLSVLTPRDFAQQERIEPLAFKPP
jgi:hypothetical protein